MNKYTLLSMLQSLFPGFVQHWNAEDIHREDDRSFTLHGLMSSFTHYYRDHWQNLPADSLRIFGKEIESIVAGDPKDETEAANAISTCFLENIAGDETGHALEKFLGKECKIFYEQWI